MKNVPVILERASSELQLGQEVMTQTPPHGHPEMSVESFERRLLLAWPSTCFLTTGARPMVVVDFTSLSRYMPIMDFESVAAITFFLEPPFMTLDGLFRRWKRERILGHALGTMSTIRKL